MKLIIIGAGPGGYETAVEAVRRGLEVTLITEGPLGGTCLNEGCIPTKSLIHDFSRERMHGVVTTLRGGIESLLKKVQLVRGKAVFADTHTVEVDGVRYTADRIIIATGSEPAVLPIPGAELALNSTQLIEREDVPESLCVIGGGVIGLEFAGIYARKGSRVTVLEYCPNLLPHFDVDIAKRLKQALVKSGIEIITSAQVTSIEKSGSACRVNYSLKDESCSLDASCALMAVGRRPTVEGLGLDGIKLMYDRKGIAVDGRMRTSVRDVYAVGDVTGGLMLAHVASAQGLRALNDMTGVEDSIDFSIVPAAVFTVPELASVGKTEEDCKAAGIEYKALKSFYRANGKALASDVPDGYCKVLVSLPDKKIIGCHILGADASDIIHEAAVLISLGATTNQVRWMIHAHPTLSEVFMAAVRSAD